MTKTKSKAPLIILLFAVAAAILIVVGIAAAVGYSMSFGEGELLESFSSADGRYSVNILGRKPAAAPDGFMRIRAVCTDESGTEQKLLERTCTFAEDEDIDMFSFSDNGACAQLVINDTHGEIVCDIIWSELSE